MAYGGRAPGGQTPNLRGGQLGAPSSQRRRTDSRHARDIGGGEFLASHRFPVLTTSGSVFG